MAPLVTQRQWHGGHQDPYLIYHLCDNLYFCWKWRVGSVTHWGDGNITEPRFSLLSSSELHGSYVLTVSFPGPQPPSCGPFPFVPTLNHTPLRENSRALLQVELTAREPPSPVSSSQYTSPGQVTRPSRKRSLRRMKRGNASSKVL